MIFKLITFCGVKATVACDARCDKAWGGSTRPRVQLSDDPDDYVYVADSALGTAPVDPGTYEGDDGKPTTPDDRLNRWCVRECERCAMSRLGREAELHALPDLEHPRPNIPHCPGTGRRVGPAIEAIGTAPCRVCAALVPVRDGYVGPHPRPEQKS